jgi:hypothetical protein
MEAAVVWTEYMKYRLGLRGFSLTIIEKILRYSSERNYLSLSSAS